MTTKQSIDLEPLAANYDLLGELSRRDDARVYFGRARETNADVFVTVTSQPGGDEGNALSHLAADTGLLRESSHRCLLPVLDGLWAGPDAYAVVTRRTNAPTLEELLARRDEAFGFPRIAAILRQLNSLLEWARSRHIVHRGIRLDAVYVEPGSDEIRVTFTARPLPSNALPEAQEDAAAIATVARAMLTRSPLAPERLARPLAELRPGLPSRVLEETEGLRKGALQPLPDVSEYIAAIAMAEELKRGEDECDRVTAEMSEEQRVTREQLAAERKAHEEDLARQAREFAAEREAARRAFEQEKQESAAAFAKEREELRRALTREREKLARERDALAAERAEFVREMTRSREQIAAKFAALDAQADLYARTTEMAVPGAEPFDAIVDEPEPEYADFKETAPAESPAAESKNVAHTRWWHRAWDARGPRSTVAAVAVLVAVIGGTSVAIARRGDVAPNGAPVRMRVLDSAAGAVGRPYLVPNAVPTLAAESLGVQRSESGQPGTGFTQERQPRAPVASPEPAAPVPSPGTTDAEPPQSVYVPQATTPAPAPPPPANSIPAATPVDTAAPPVAPVPWLSPWSVPAPAPRRDSVRQQQPVRIPVLPLPDSILPPDTSALR